MSIGYYDETTNDDYIFTKTHLNNEDTKNVFVNMTPHEKNQYIDKIKKETGKNFMDHPLRNYYERDILQFKNKLYKKEYTRSGEIEYLNSYCDNSNVANTVYKYKNTFRILTYNVHSFINSCNVFYRNNGKMTDIINFDKKTDNTKLVMQLLYLLDADIIGFQEFSPTIYDNSGFLRIRNFMDTYNKNKPGNAQNIKNYVISDCKNNDDKMAFFGNAVMSTHDINQKNVIKYDVFNNKNRKIDTRCFLQIKITYEENDIIFYNIHPSSEAENKSSKEQIFDFFKSIGKDTLNKNIIVVGDFNTDSPIIHNTIEQIGFFNVNKLLNLNSEDEYTGYHGTTIDYIYVSNHFLNHYTPVQTKILTVNISDHCPIIFDFKKKDKNYVNDSYKNILGRYYYDIGKIILLKEQNIMERLNNYYYQYEYIIKKALEFGEIVNLNDQTYLFHGTSSINFDNSNIPFEVTEELYNIKTVVPKSFTLLHYAGESFSNFYGTNDDHSFKRGIIYKIKENHKLPVLNLYKKISFNERAENRLSFYIELYNSIRAKLIDYNIFDNKELIESSDAFVIMRVLWILLMPIYLSITDTNGNDSYNKHLFYGTINSDFINADTTYINNSIKHKKTHSLWKNVELYEGLEVMIYDPIKFLEFVGVYYNGTFYSKNDWINDSPNIVTDFKNNQQSYLNKKLLLKIPDIRDTFTFPRLYAEKYMLQYLLYYLIYIIKLYQNTTFTNPIILNNIDNLLVNIFHRNHSINNFKSNTALNLILKDYMEQLDNVKYAEFITNPLIGGSYIDDNHIPKEHYVYKKSQFNVYEYLLDVLEKNIPDNTQNAHVLYIKNTLKKYFHNILQKIVVNIKPSKYYSKYQKYKTKYYNLLNKTN